MARRGGGAAPAVGRLLVVSAWSAALVRAKGTGGGDATAAAECHSVDAWGESCKEHEAGQLGHALCPHVFCPDCDFAGQCDRACGFCSVTTTSTTTPCFSINRRGDATCEASAVMCPVLFCPTCPESGAADAADVSGVDDAEDQGGGEPFLLPADADGMAAASIGLWVAIASVLVCALGGLAGVCARCRARPQEKSALNPSQVLPGGHNGFTLKPEPRSAPVCGQAPREGGGSPRAVVPADASTWQEDAGVTSDCCGPAMLSCQDAGVTSDCCSPAMSSGDCLAAAHAGAELAEAAATPICVSSLFCGSSAGCSKAQHSDLDAPVDALPLTTDALRLEERERDTRAFMGERFKEEIEMYTTEMRGRGRAPRGPRPREGRRDTGRGVGLT